MIHSCFHGIYVFVFLSYFQLFSIFQARIKYIALLDSKIDGASDSIQLRVEKDDSEIKANFKLENDSLKTDHANFVKVFLIYFLFSFDIRVLVRRK